MGAVVSDRRGPMSFRQEYALAWILPNAAIAIVVFALGHPWLGAFWTVALGIYVLAGWWMTRPDRKE